MSVVIQEMLRDSRCLAEIKMQVLTSTSLVTLLKRKMDFFCESIIITPNIYIYIYIKVLAVDGI